MKTQYLEAEATFNFTFFKRSGNIRKNERNHKLRLVKRVSSEIKYSQHLECFDNSLPKCSRNDEIADIEFLKKKSFWKRFLNYSTYVQSLNIFESILHGISLKSSETIETIRDRPITPSLFIALRWLFWFEDVTNQKLLLAKIKTNKTKKPR